MRIEERKQEQEGDRGGEREVLPGSYRINTLPPGPRFFGEGQGGTQHGQWEGPWAWHAGHRPH